MKRLTQDGSTVALVNCPGASQPYFDFRKISSERKNGKSLFCLIDSKHHLWIGFPVRGEVIFERFSNQLGYDILFNYNALESFRVVDKFSR